MQDGNPFMIGDGVPDKCSKDGKPVPMVDKDGKKMKPKMQAYGGALPGKDTGESPDDVRAVYPKKGAPQQMFGPSGPQHTPDGTPLAVYDSQGNQVPTLSDDGKPILYCYGGPIAPEAYGAPSKLLGSGKDEKVSPWAEALGDGPLSPEEEGQPIALFDEDGNPIKPGERDGDGSVPAESPFHDSDGKSMDPADAAGKDVDPDKQLFVTPDKEAVAKDDKFDPLHDRSDPKKSPILFGDGGDSGDEAGALPHDADGAEKPVFDKHGRPVSPELVREAFPDKGAGDDADGKKPAGKDDGKGKGKLTGVGKGKGKGKGKDEDGGDKGKEDGGDEPILAVAGPPVDESEVVPSVLCGLGGPDSKPVPLFDRNGDPVLLGAAGSPDEKFNKDGEPVPLYDDKGKPIVKSPTEPKQAYGSPLGGKGDDIVPEIFADPAGKKPMLFGPDGPQHDKDGTPIPLFDADGNPVPAVDSTGKPILHAYAGPQV